VRLRVAFEGAVSRRDNEGIFAVQEADAWYLFTQFQALAARRAFPCFDEPSYKIPWQVTLRVPRGAVALSNGAVTATRQDGDRDVVSFAETPALPSYLVAFAVGPFDLVDVGPSGRNRTPTRLAVPRGRAADTAWARESTPRLLSLLEDYFDRPYPHAKLDQVAIPGAGFAMEHPGLVTYGQSYMVRPAGEETIASRQGWASLAAHELAHQWFGNSLTVRSWRDIWLHEGFACYAEWLWSEESGGRPADAHAQQHWRRLARLPQELILADPGPDLMFDDRVYKRGALVLHALRLTLGDETFFEMLRAWVGANAYGTVTTGMFVAHVQQHAGRPVGGLLDPWLFAGPLPALPGS
jgi:alanyl aminopeptidase